MEKNLGKDQRYLAGDFVDGLGKPLDVPCRDTRDGYPPVLCGVHRVLVEQIKSVHRHMMSDRELFNSPPWPIDPSARVLGPYKQTSRSI
jgi:hypothetical protein